MKTLNYLFKDRFMFIEVMITTWVAIAFNINGWAVLGAVVLTGVIFYITRVRNLLSTSRTFSIVDLVTGMVISYYMSRAATSFGLWLIFIGVWSIALFISTGIQQWLENREAKKELYD